MIYNVAFWKERKNSLKKPIFFLIFFGKKCFYLLSELYLNIPLFKLHTTDSKKNKEIKKDTK